MGKQVEEKPEPEVSHPTAGATPVLPPVPDSLEIDPLLLALLHITAFVDFADDELEGEADPATEALERVGHYVQRLPDERIDELDEQLERLATYGERSNWDPEVIEFVRDFLYTCGIEDDEENGELDESEAEDEEEVDDEDS